MSDTLQNVFKNAEGKWLAVWESHTHTGHHKVISFVDDINLATVMPYLDWDMKRRIDCEVTAVRVIRTITTILFNPDAMPAELAIAVNSKSSVPVSHWDNYKVKPLAEHDFMIDVDDQRATKGQMFIDIGAKEGQLDDLFAVTLEVNRLLSKSGADDNPCVPCVHIHFDSDNMAGSLFKVADKIIFRPETDVFISEILLDNGEKAYQIDSLNR